MGYLHITNLYKDQTLLIFKEVFALEKIHGTSAHLSWTNKQLGFHSGGASHVEFVKLFDVEALTALLLEKFGEIPVTIYGEAYGGTQQGMSKVYGPTLKFIVFDVKINDSWLAVPNAEDVVSKLNLEFVYYTTLPTDVSALDSERDAFSVQAVRNGMGNDKPREGIVLRPVIELTTNNGERVIAKHKGEAFRETRTERKVNPDKQKVLEEASAIADEWVTAMRLEHVLQKFQPDVSIESTGAVIKAMIEDVFREAEGEIVESREAKSAISKKTADLFKFKLQAVLK
jgi:hypothetical protein